MEKTASAKALLAIGTLATPPTVTSNRSPGTQRRTALLPGPGRAEVGDELVEQHRIRRAHVRAKGALDLLGREVPHELEHELLLEVADDEVLVERRGAQPSPVDGRGPDKAESAT